MTKAKQIKLPQKTYQRPILSEELENQLTDAVQAFEKRGKWKEWGLDKIREQGVALLLHGPPGTGKTMTVYYLSRRLHLGIREVSVADYGSQVPGQLARNIKQIFNGELISAQQDGRHEPVIFLDECDSMLVSRNKLGHDMMWMLEPINSLLNCISTYPGLVILSTNLVPLLDEALERRLLARIYVAMPDSEVRKKIWQAKWPDKFPCQPSKEEVNRLAIYPLSGAEIENCFLLWAGSCMRKGVTPKVEDLLTRLVEDYPNELAV
jgi:SpoVK/Ycf46/Vps4 family AAA+-type ATPase